MADETKNKIVQSMIKLIIDRGYTLTTTKDIAKYAGVSEVTIYRKFASKLDIVKYALEEILMKPELDSNILEKCTWSLEEDLKMFSDLYFKFVTPDYLKLIIGVRSPDLFPEIEKCIINIPNKFMDTMKKYFAVMYEKKKIKSANFEAMAAMYMSLNLGFIFVKTSFGSDVLSLGNEEYIAESIKMFAKGI